MKEHIWRGLSGAAIFVFLLLLADPAVSAAAASRTDAKLTAQQQADAGLPVVRRPNGSVIIWHLDRRGADATQGILVLAQGSGCATVLGNPNIEAAKVIAPDFAVVTIEKYGVNPKQRPKDETQCTDVFNTRNTVSQRADDLVAVINRVSEEPWWNKRIILFGGSEGGDVVQIAARRLKPDALILLSGASGWPMSRVVAETLPFPLSWQAKSRLAAARANPHSPNLWAGQSYTWWADIADREVWKESALASMPILVIQGYRDRSVPVEAARAFRDQFPQDRRCLLTYWEYPDYDHIMKDKRGKSHLEQVLRRVGEWASHALEANDRRSTLAPCAGSGSP